MFKYFSDKGRMNYGTDVPKSSCSLYHALLYTITLSRVTSMNKEQKKKDFTCFLPLLFFLHSSGSNVFLNLAMCFSRSEVTTLTKKRKNQIVHQYLHEREGEYSSVFINIYDLQIVPEDFGSKRHFQDTKITDLETRRMPWSRN